MRKRKVRVSLSENNFNDLWTRIVPDDSPIKGIRQTKMPQWNVGINPQDRETLNKVLQNGLTVNVGLVPETQQTLDKNIRYLTNGIVISAIGYAVISQLRRRV